MAGTTSETVETAWAVRWAVPGVDLPRPREARTTRPSPPVRHLQEAVAALQAHDAAALPGDQALADVEALLRASERLQVLALSRLADADRRDLPVLEGAASSTPAWVQQLHVGLAPSQVALARRLHRHPAVAAAVATGTIPVAAAERVVRALHQLRRHVDRPDGLIDGRDAEQTMHAVVVDGVLLLLAEARGGWAADDPELLALLAELRDLVAEPTSQLARLEAAMLVLARDLEPQHLPHALEMLVGAVLPVQLQERADAAEAERGLVLVRKPDGSGYTVRRGDLSLEAGELLLAVLAAATATDPAAPSDTAARAADRDDGTVLDGDLDTGSHALPRSRAQAAHDALVLALRALLDAGALGSRGKQAPHLAVTVSLDALHGRPGALPAVSPSGAPLPVGLVRRWAEDSRLTRFVLSLGRRVVETSHTERTLKAHERRALLLRWGHRCAVRGCCSPPGAPLAPHHVEPWHRTGTTSLTDTVPLCDASHHDLHEGGQVLTLRDGTRIGADGWVTEPSA